jgi:hypothetical protein
MEICEHFEFWRADGHQGQHQGRDPSIDGYIAALRRRRTPGAQVQANRKSACYRLENDSKPT